MPTAIAKTMGVYTINYRGSGGKTIKQDLVVMENLFYNCHITRVCLSLSLSLSRVFVFTHDERTTASRCSI